MDWKGGGVALHGGANVRTTTNNNTADTTTVVKTVNRDQTSDTDDDDGPYFDLEFALPDEEDNNGGSNSVDDGDEEREDDFESEETDSEDERDFEFTLSSGSSGDRNFSLSPSDDLFFQGRLAPIDPSSMEFNSSELNSKSQFHASLLKSASKFRAMMLKFKKSKSNVSERTESDHSAPATPKQQQRQQQVQNQESQSKFFTVNLKTEESGEKSASDEKRFSEDVKQRYLKIVKPLYVRVSKRYGEKLRFSGQSPPSTVALEPHPAGKSQSKALERTEAPPPDNVKSRKQVSVPAGLRVVRKHLGKSLSASSVVAAAPPPASGPVTSRRRDDSLLQQQDGIQSAILHCKRSFKASKDSSWEEGEESI